MIRVITFLILLALIALGITWIADRPGEVAITWLGYRIETSIMVMLAALLLAVAVCIMIWSLLRSVWLAPSRMKASMRRKREERGRRAVMRGLIAVGAGDARAARRYTDDAKKIARDEPLTLLLTAQAAQLSGDRAEAERTFRAMTEHEPTRLLGLRGLFIEAQRRDDLANARLYAEEAAKIAPSLPWAGMAALQIRCAEGDFAGALDMLERNRASGALDRATFKRQRAVLLTAQAIALEQSNRDGAKAAAYEAVKLAPDLVPAAAMAGRFMAENGELRKAAKVIERAYRASPHPDLAETYIYLRYGDSALDRLGRARKLAAMVPNNVEGAVALARTALKAREFAEARKALAPYLAQPSQRIALLMAELEQADGNEGAVREWTARAVHASRDPAWTADGFVSDRWLPISPVSGRIDAFEWKAQVPEISGPVPAFEDSIAAEPETPATAMIEVTPAAVIDETPAPEADPVPAARPAEPAMVAQDRLPPPPAELHDDVGNEIRKDPGKDIRKAPQRPAARAETIIPLAPVPDDPGAGPDQDIDPLPETPAGGPGWRRVF